MVLLIPIKTAADANQFISIMDSLNFKVDKSQLHRGKAGCTVGQVACVWSGHRDYIGTRLESSLQRSCIPYHNVPVNQLYKRLQEQ